MSLLQVKNLVVEFPGRRGTLRALDDISFDIAPGEILGVVGESGAGKSLTGASIIGLLEPPGRVASGEILLQGRRIDNLPHDEMRKVRGPQDRRNLPGPADVAEPPVFRGPPAHRDHHHPSAGEPSRGAQACH
jgi:ABC-type oligopeptide transport system ATPase subunit